MEVLPEPGREPGDGIRPASRNLMPEPRDGASCACQGCINLNVQNELRNLEQDQEILASQEQSLLRFMIRNGVGALDDALLSIVLEPVFESIEQVYSTVDALVRYEDQEQHDPGTSCPYESLVEELDRKMRLFLRVSEGDREGILEELDGVFGPESFSVEQSLDSLGGDSAARQLPLSG